MNTAAGQPLQPAPFHGAKPCAGCGDPVPESTQPSLCHDCHADAVAPPPAKPCATCGHPIHRHRARRNELCIPCAIARRR